VKNVDLHSRVDRKRRVSSFVRYSTFSAPVSTTNQKAPTKPEVYWLERTPVDFYSFDEEYLRRLGARDPATEAHFVEYFSERLRITLRARGVDSHTIEDVRQETFCRVWVAVQSGNVNNPRGFGSYVHSVCKHVLSENRRFNFRNQHDPLDSTDVADGRLGLEEMMQRREHGKLVRAVLSELPERDRNILQARFFDDRDNDDVCHDFGVDRDYVRVLLHRAINKFGERYKKRSN
jgi:RNA polymerase sigma-70 factor (ECF subfamily)